MTTTSWPLIVPNLFDRKWLLTELSWRVLHEDVFISPIYSTENSQSQAAVLHYLPGSKIPRHRHPGYEHILILHGSQRDGKNTYGPGTLVISNPESQHQIDSPEGCIALGIWEKPVEFLC